MTATTRPAQATISTVVVLTPAIIGPTQSRTLTLATDTIDLEQLHQLVDIDTFDAVEGRAGIDIWVDDEGLYAPLPQVNLAATTLDGRRLVGPAIITGYRPEDGAAIGLNPRQLATVDHAAHVHRGPHFTG